MVERFWGQRRIPMRLRFRVCRRAYRTFFVFDQRSLLVPPPAPGRISRLKKSYRASIGIHPRARHLIFLPRRDLVMTPPPLLVAFIRMSLIETKVVLTPHRFSQTEGPILRYVPSRPPSDLLFGWEASFSRSYRKGRAAIASNSSP